MEDVYYKIHHLSSYYKINSIKTNPWARMRGTVGLNTELVEKSSRRAAKSAEKQTSTGNCIHAPSPKRLPLIMGNSSGDICYLSRQSIKQRRRSDGAAGSACGNRPIFRVNKHKSSTRQVIPSTASLSIGHPWIVCRHGDGTHARTHAREE